MDSNQILKRLESARSRQRKLRKDIDRYRQQLRDAGINPDKPMVDLVPRNKNIFKAWKRGLSFVEIAAQSDLSTTRVSSICHRIDAILNRETVPKEYSDLLRYKVD